MLPLAKLKTQLQKARVPAAGQLLREFVPEGCLKQILTTTAVLSVLADPVFEVPPHKRESTAQIIASEGQIVFALLLDLNLERELSRFIEQDVLDRELFSSIDRLEDVVPQAAKEIAKRRWDYRAYRFRKGQYQRKVLDEEILPYIDQTMIGGGGYSSVYRVLIHPNHQNIVSDAPSSVRLPALGTV